MIDQLIGFGRDADDLQTLGGDPFRYGPDDCHDEAGECGKNAWALQRVSRDISR
jgi:hypothetical protein